MQSYTLHVEMSKIGRFIKKVQEFELKNNSKSCQ